eukprot:TRINITY_DN1322_c0_g1_i1.p1 TRINITY_DN1322_c0_g1~~TRINITY_DN1322_c0_g1_i1.p1  ORF type:complete len:161 (-),score=4.25 TRINITY_DN1322_c0_g1_i1:57-539(-)
MTTIVPKAPNPERLLNIVLGYNALLEIGASFIFMFRPNLVYPKISHETSQVSGFLANALLCIGIVSALILYLKVSLRIKKAISMAFLLYNALLSWMLLRVVTLERKTVDSAAISMFGHMTATILFAVALYRTQNAVDMSQTADKISSKIPVVATERQKEA